MYHYFIVIFIHYRSKIAKKSNLWFVVGEDFDGKDGVKHSFQLQMIETKYYILLKTAVFQIVTGNDFHDIFNTAFPLLIWYSLMSAINIITLLLKGCIRYDSLIPR